MMRKQCERIMTMTFPCSGVTSAATQVWSGDCVWPLVSPRPEPQCPVSRCHGVTCDVWRCDQPLCVTSEGNAATMERCSRSRIIDTVTRTTNPPSHPRAPSHISDAAQSGDGCLDMDRCRHCRLSQWLKFHWLRIKFGLSFLIHIFLSIVFYFLIIIDSVNCFIKIFYMLLDYGDYDDLLYFLILYSIYKQIPKNETMIIFPNLNTLSKIESLVVFKTVN